MGRKSLKNQRRLEIVKAFVEVAHEEGVENTTLGQLAEHMSINVSLILHYFKSKDELLKEVGDFVLSQYLNIFNSHFESQDQSIQDLIEDLFSKKWNEFFSDRVYYDLYAMTTRNSEFRQNFTELHQSLHSTLAEILDQYNQKGEIHCKNSPKLSTLIFTILDGWYYHATMIDNEERIEETRKYSIECVLGLLGL